MLRLSLVTSLLLIIVILVVATTKFSRVPQSAEIILMTAFVPGCGNQILEGAEECDGTELAGATCSTKGFSSGTLSCTRSCLYNTTACVSPTNSGGGGGGGGKVTSNKSTVNTAEVVLTGQAYPNSVVTVLKDSQTIATAVADSKASFQVAVSGLAAGRYSFSLFTQDAAGTRSAPVAVPLIFTKGSFKKVDNIFFPPTLRADKVQVKQGDKIEFRGQSVPTAGVSIGLQAGQRFIGQATSSIEGAYNYSFDTAALAYGTYTVKVFATNNRALSPLSTMITFTVGATNILSESSPQCNMKGDLNNDCKVNIVDFSIMAFWYQRVLTPAFTVREREHLSGDGKVDITDFSIMAFHWTG